MSYKIDRNKFIDWLDSEQLIDTYKEIRFDLKSSGEYIITASGLLDAHTELPVHLIDNYEGDNKFESSCDCELIYKQPFE